VKTVKQNKLLTLTVILLLLVSQLAVFKFTPSSTVKAQEPSLPSTVWSEFPSFEPKLLIDYPSAGYLTWNTTFGLYTVDKSLYWFSFKDRYGVQQVSKSVFWINTTATIDIAKITNVQVTVKNDTTFQVKYSATYKGGGLTKDTVVGNFTVTFKFYRDVKPKISVQFVKDESAWSIGGLGDFNVVWVLLPTKNYLKINETSAVDYTAYTSMVKIKETTVKEDKKCEVGDSANPSAWTGSWLLAFWDDVEDVSVLYAGLDKVFGSKGITVVFPVNDGQIDPSVVGTSTTSVAIGLPFQRNAFYANGLFWVFYIDGSNLVYKTSTDGSSWSSATVVRSASSTSVFSVWFDGTYVHYTFTLRDYNQPILYRRGTISGSSISWAVEQTAVSGNSAYLFDFVTIAVDANGYPWIGYQRYDSADYMGNALITKSNRNDGTWETASGFPYVLAEDGCWFVIPVPLSNGYTYIVYAQEANSAYGRLWTGSWGSIETIRDSGAALDYCLSAVADGNDVYVVQVWHQYGNPQGIVSRKRTYGVGWGTEQTVMSGADYFSYPSLFVNPSNHVLYCFWMDYPTANHIYYKKYQNGAWDTSETDWITESGTIYYLVAFYSSSNYAGLCYVTAGYNVKFAYLSLAVADTTPPTYSNVGTNTTRAGQPCKFSAKWTDNVGLSGFIFGTNNTGVWVNDTWTAWTGSPTTAWSNVTKTLNSAVHVVVCWQIWANDTSNNWNTTGIQTLTTTGTFYSSTSQPLSISPTPSRQSTYNRAALQPLQILLTASRLLSLKRIAGQLVNFITSTTRQTSYARVTSQLLQLLFSTSRHSTYGRTAFQTLSALTQTARQLIFPRFPTQTLSILTAASRSQTLQRTSSQILTVLLSTYRQASYNRLIQQPLTLLTEASRHLTLSRSAGQILTPSAQSARSQTLTRVIQQPLNILLSITRQATFTRQINQPLNFLTTSSLVKLGGVIQRYASQALTILTQTTRQQSLNRIVQQPLNILLSVTRQAFYSRTAEVLLQINMQTAIRIIIYLPPAPSPAPAPMPMPSIQLDLIIQTAHITRLWWQPTTTVEVLVINKGTVSTDVTFEYTLLDSRNQTVTQGTLTVFISGLDKKTVSISIPTPPDGKYTFKFKAVEPVEVEAKAVTLTVETPFYGRPEFTALILLIAATIYIIKKRRHR